MYSVLFACGMCVRIIVALDAMARATMMFEGQTPEMVSLIRLDSEI